MKTYNSLQLAGVQLVMGEGACEGAAELLTGSGVKKPMIITDKGIRNQGLLRCIETNLTENNIKYEIFDEVESDPDDSVCRAAVRSIKEKGCDGVIAVGGGSVMDSAKTAKVLVNNEGDLFDYDNSPTGGKKFRNRGIYTICIPTTSGTGSEVTPYTIITNPREERKATINSPYLLADAAILDPNLTENMPPSITAGTGMDALAHAIGGYTSKRSVYAGGTTLLSDALEIRSMELIGENLRECVKHGNNKAARLNMMLASTIGGIVISAGGDAGHGLGHALGSIYHIPHGIACAMVLPEVMEYNYPACPERFADIAKALGVDISKMSLEEAAAASVVAVRKLMEDIEIPKLSKYLNSTEGERFEKMCEVAEQEKCSKINLKQITKETAKELYVKAYGAN